MNTAAIKPFIFSGEHRFFFVSSQILPQDPDESSSRLTTDCDRSFPGLLHMCHTMLPCCLCSGGRFVFVPLCHSVLAFNLFQTHPYFLCSVKWCNFFVDSLFLKWLPSCSVSHLVFDLVPHCQVQNSPLVLFYKSFCTRQRLVLRPNNEEQVGTRVGGRPN